MTKKEHRRTIEKGVSAWNTWRAEHRQERIRLSGEDLWGIELKGINLSEAELIMADLREVNLREADLSRAVLIGAKLNGACLREADLSEANLSQAVLIGANLIMARLRAADLSLAHLNAANLGWAVLSAANLRKADLSGADLTHANLTEAILIRTNFKEAKLNDCHIYGISVWDLDLTGAEQAGLIITPHNEPTITVDNLEVAQFIYLLLHNEKIRHVIDTITSKVVLILGRFTPERKVVLDAIREALRQRDWLPVLFDFPSPTSRDLTETITILARMARFIIADITDAKSIPQELGAIVPHLPSVPVQPLLESSASEYGMFEHFKRYPWVLEVYQYGNLDQLLHSLEHKVILPAEAKAQELRKTIS